MDPQVQAFLDVVAATKPPGWDSMTPAEARERFSTFAPLLGKGPEEVQAQPLQLADRVPARMYRPSPPVASGRLPVVVYFHGGGWVLGNLDSHDSLCRRLCQESGCAVIAIDYRLAPEHPYPAALDDSYDATMDIAKRASDWELDANRILVAGDSAGGNLATGVCMRARDRSGPSICGQVLIYPVIDAGCNTPSYERFAEGFGLTRAGMMWFWNHYTGSGPKDGFASPSLAKDLRGLPPALVVTAECDVLRDEAETYARRLQDSGVPVQSKRYQGVIHGFIHFAGAFDIGKRATSEIAQHIRQMAARGFQPS
jgi:acetyl esterase